MGAMAGFASALMAALGTTGAAMLAVPVSQAFDGSTLPLVGGVTLFMALALALTPLLRKV
jgi:hypothetical protein